MIDATAIVMTKNEEKNIVECLKSVQDFAKRVLVIDCGSTDRTVELAKENGADVVFHEFEYYAKQFNWGIENGNIDTEWIIRLDADERFTPELKAELEAIVAKNEPDVHGVILESDYYFLGRMIKYGLRKKRKMMLFKKAYGYLEDRRRDPHSTLREGRSVQAKCRFLHYDFKDLDTYIRRYNWYATREMMDYIEYTRGENLNKPNDAHIQKQRKRKYGVYYRAPRFLRAWLWFLYTYIFRLGFLDGKEGFLYFFFECYWYRMLVDAKIYEYEKNGGEFEQLKACD